MKKILLSIMTTAALGMAAVAGDAQVVAGKGVCAKCALKEASSCQNAIQAEEDGKKVTYYLAHNDVSKAFHKNVCQGSTPVVAKGKVVEEGGKHKLVASKIDVAKEIKGEGKCAKCALKEASSCQNAIAVNEEGKKVTYYLAQNDVSKAFHKNLCTSSAKVAAIGTVKEKDGKKVFEAAKIAKID